jgi:peptide/nickel transport system permease protein
VGRYIVRRLIYSIPVLLIASILVFMVVRTTVNPAAALRGNPRVTAEQQQRYAEDLGLNDPLPTQYWKWLSAFLVGDWGTSLLTNIPVFPQIRDAMINSLVLGLTASVVSLLFGVAIGLYSSLRQYSKFDYIATTGAFVGLSMPIFWFALILQLIFGVWITQRFNLSEPILYTAGVSTPGEPGFDLLDRVRHLALPIIVLSVQVVAVYSRYMRASMLEVLQSDYLRTARAKGLRERIVIGRHALRNSLLPVVTIIGLSLGTLVGGAILTETIFNITGVGKTLFDAISGRDYFVVQGFTLVVAIGFVLINLITDIVYTFLDPKVRVS